MADVERKLDGLRLVRKVEQHNAPLAALGMMTQASKDRRMVLKDRFILTSD